MNSKAKRWLLPDGVDEILPPRARQLEILRREILDLYGSWGYDLVKTPLIEFLDSLLILPGQELQLSTFKLVDQLSGKSMGVRADISSQAARIDAHVLQREGTTRLCYADSVLRTRPRGPLGSRSPQLVGAELYGHGGVESDIEVIGLLLRTLQVAGIEQPLLALGHSRICRILLRAAALPGDDEQRLFAALQNKATADIELLLGELPLSSRLRDCLHLLPTLHGNREVLEQAASLCADLDPALPAALAELRAIADALQREFPAQQLYFDLCELRGYDYHTGVIFSAYVGGHGEAIANGGRYDAIGAAFGRARPATGFDADLKTLLALSRRAFAEEHRIFAPLAADAALQRRIAELRSGGQAVVQALDETETPAILGCTAWLEKSGGDWQVVTMQDK